MPNPEPLPDSRIAEIEAREKAADGVNGASAHAKQKKYLTRHLTRRLPMLAEDAKVGMREYFAGQALQGCLAYSYVNPHTGNYHENCDAKGVALSCVKYADAMIAALNEKQAVPEPPAPREAGGAYGTE